MEFYFFFKFDCDFDVTMITVQIVQKISSGVLTANNLKVKYRQRIETREKGKCCCLRLISLQIDTSAKKRAKRQPVATRSV